MRRWIAAYAATAATLVLTACGGESDPVTSGGTNLPNTAAIDTSAGSTSATSAAAQSSSSGSSHSNATNSRSTSPTRPYRIVVLGDSLSVEPPHECADCTTYLTEFANGLDVARKVEMLNRAVPDTGIADLQKSINGSLVDDLATADLVLVWIGNNDGPPWPDASPCGPVPTDQVDALLAGVEGYTPRCIKETIQQYRAKYDSLFAAVSAASPGAQHLALTTYDNWLGNSFLDDSKMTKKRLDAILEKVAGTFDDWNVAQCSAAKAHAFSCVDTYHLVNGADGRRPGGKLFASDGTHLSQAGHDAVAGLLRKVALTTT